MIRVCGVRFQEEGKMFYYNAGELTPSVGDYVIADTERGIELGEVMLGVTEMAEENIKGPLPALVRIATPRDVQQATENRAREQEAYAICQRKIAEHKLEMKLVSVETMFDNSRMIFYFTANGRVDFRGLVKDLASTFRTRIELRQIGVRDEARMLGGLGPCGRPICCGSFLSDFQPVSIKMAKEQNLSLNPTKISGVCGRLMCCLKYEQDQYEQTRKRMPRVGREVETPDGIGVVTDLNIVKETVFVRISTGDIAEIREYPLEKITRPGQEAVPAQEELEKETLSDLALEMETGLEEENDPALAEVMDEENDEPQAEKPHPAQRGEKKGRAADRQRQKGKTGGPAGAGSPGQPEKRPGQEAGEAGKRKRKARPGCVPPGTAGAPGKSGPGEKGSPGVSGEGTKHEPPERRRAEPETARFPHRREEAGSRRRKSPGVRCWKEVQRLGGSLGEGPEKAEK